MKSYFKTLVTSISVILMGIMIFYSNALSQNSFGGLCCDYDFSTCHHPIGMDFENARWAKNKVVCPEPEID